MIRLTNVEKIYANGARAINGISFEIEDGEFVFLVGHSGSGKSTIIKMLTGEIGPSAGRVMINGYNMNNISSRQIPHMRRTIGVIFQDFRLLEKKNVYENMVFAMRAVGASPGEIKRRIPYVLELVGLENKSRRLPGELSGGEQQRVAIARALINEPSILLADEPTGNLDNNNAWEIMKLLEEVNDRGTTVIVVTHNMEIVKVMKKRVITVQKGVIVSDSKAGGETYES